MYVNTDKSAGAVADFGTVQTQQTYLPKGTDWYDFWNNEKYTGGQTVERETPIDIIPVYVKSGTILPIGPDVQYATEKNWDDMVINIYPGADGSFTLYEDEFDNYNYEQGAFSKIYFSWNNAHRKLTISKRNGAYEGLIINRKFTIILPDGTQREVDYNGKKLIIRF